MRTVAVIWLFFERHEAESFYLRSAHPALPRAETPISRVRSPACLRLGKSSYPLPAVLLIGKTVELCRAGGN